MPRAVQQAREPDARWILVEHPAARPGWYEVKAIRRSPGWVTVDCGRGTPYVVRDSWSLWWSPVRPPAEWWKPW